jgi:hypothetical protein
MVMVAGTIQAEPLPALYKGDNKMNVLILQKPFTMFSTPTTQQDAFRAAKQFVRARLGHPNLAAFADASSSTISALGNNTFKISSEWGYIGPDGSTIETDWSATVYYSPERGRWYLLKLKQTLSDD